MSGNEDFDHDQAVNEIVKDAVRRAGTRHTMQAMMSLAGLAFAYLLEDDVLPRFTAFANANTHNEDVTPEDMGTQLAMQGILVTSLGREAQVADLEELFNKS